MGVVSSIFIFEGSLLKVSEYRIDISVVVIWVGVCSIGVIMVRKVMGSVKFSVQFFGIVWFSVNFSVQVMVYGMQ